MLWLFWLDIKVNRLERSDPTSTDHNVATQRNTNKSDVIFIHHQGTKSQQNLGVFRTNNAQTLL
jgi:hypothetical protein